MSVSAISVLVMIYGRASGCTARLRILGFLSPSYRRFMVVHSWRPSPWGIFSPGPDREHTQESCSLQAVDLRNARRGRAESPLRWIRASIMIWHRTAIHRTASASSVSPARALRARMSVTPAFGARSRKRRRFAFPLLSTAYTQTFRNDTTSRAPRRLLPELRCATAEPGTPVRRYFFI